MKQIKRFIISTVLLGVTVLFATPDQAQGVDHSKEVVGTDFAILELFTSEGCSSCPAADNLMARLQREATGKSVYILSYHVDYWNHQGWRDQFSSAQFTARQRKYAQWLGDPQIYTPQLVINGKFSCVGSDESTIRLAQINVLNSSTSSSLSIEAQQLKDKMTLHYRLNDDGTHRQLLVAVIQKHASTNVKRGENGGHTLKHVQVVHDLAAFDASRNKEGDVSILLPKEFNNQEWEIIALVQNTENGEMIAATRPQLADPL